jgi:hypothetical protein
MRPRFRWPILLFFPALVLFFSLEILLSEIKAVAGDSANGGGSTMTNIAASNGAPPARAGDLSRPNSPREGSPRSDAILNRRGSPRRRGNRPRGEINIRPIYEEKSGFYVSSNSTGQLRAGFNPRRLGRRWHNRYSGWASGLGGEKITYYDHLDSKNFPMVLNQLAYGLAGPVTWPDYQYYQGSGNANALIKLFEYLNGRINAIIGQDESVSPDRRLELTVDLIREELEKIVSDIAIMDDNYYVKFKLATGGRSPWSRMPVNFYHSNLRPAELARQP